jgi:hypothetical protein
MQQYEQQSQQMMAQYQQVAVQAQQTGQQPPPQPQMGPPPPPPVNPFQPKPNDTEPAVALKWMKRLSRLMLDPAYDAMPPEWQNLVNQKYQTVSQAIHPGPQGLPDASYQQFVSDVTKKALMLSTSFIGQELAGGMGAQKPQAPQGQPQGPQDMQRLNAEKQGYQQAIAKIHATEPDPKMRTQKLQHAQQIYKSRILTLDKPKQPSQAA